MALSWNEIKSRAIIFSKEWEAETNENAEAKSFWDGFFSVFGIGRRRVASFEEPVKKLGNKRGYIDLFWKGNLIVEHKSKGKDLSKAYQQAIDYFPGIREEELPKYVLVSDFEKFRLYDLDEGTQQEFLLSELHKNVKLFGFIAGYQKMVIRDEDPINIKAAEKMGKLHDLLKENGYHGHELEVYLVRLLFMLFADDTGIFEKDVFWDLIENHTAEDGSDLAIKLAQLFEVLNTSPEKRLKNLDEIYAQFPYINGTLFKENISFAAFDSNMRKLLLESCGLDWGLISPAIFGSLFQSIMDKNARRNFGAHYTSEKNILKLIKPLFLDELSNEFEKIKNNRQALFEFHEKISELRFLDPACGSGNFLIIAYRELRELELKVVYQILKLDKLLNQMSFLNIQEYFKVSVSQFYGIEIDEWAARIAEVAMWLVDHQMNIKASNLVGKYLARIPLTLSAKIIHSDSLTTDWQSLLNPVNTYEVIAKHTNIYLISEPKEEYGTLNVKTSSYQLHKGELPNPQNKIKFDYILGNPPYIGSKFQTVEQRSSVVQEFGNSTGAGVLDYVSAWFIKAAKYIQNSKTKVAFVATNSITQGEQVAILWNEMLQKYKVSIHFAHRTFKWSNEAKGQAAVYCVIIGFANYDIDKKIIFDYDDIKGDPTPISATNINPYLVDAANLLITKRTKPIANVSRIKFGNQPNDNGALIFTEKEKIEFVKMEPNSEKWFKRFVGSRDFLNNEIKWCLWLKNISPSELRSMPHILKRVQQVKIHRINSVRKATNQLADTPTIFGFVSHTDTDYILVPRVSSENRKYIPIGFFTKDFIAGDTCLTMPNANIYDFGILTSEMHMAWVKYVCGRLKSDFRYSNTIVYNNYPFPMEVNAKQRAKVEEAAQFVLDIRENYPQSSLADLYDPLAMPPDLMNAHKELDRAVDMCYRQQPFANEKARIEFLFELYGQYVTPLHSKLSKEKKKK